MNSFQYFERNQFGFAYTFDIFWSIAFLYVSVPIAYANGSVEGNSPRIRSYLVQVTAFH